MNAAPEVAPDSHGQLDVDVRQVRGEVTLFLGGQDLVMRFNHPGCLINAIFCSDAQTNEALTRLIDKVCLLANRSVMLCPSVTENTCPHSHVIDRLLETLYYLQQALKSSLLSYRLVRDLAANDTVSNVHVTDDQIGAGVQRFSRMDADDTNRLQNLLLYLLNITHSSNMRRNGTDIYQKVFTSSGHDTLAWRRTQSIKEFVYSSARKELNFDQWLNLTSSSGNASAATEHLTFCHDIQFQRLERDRHVFSFSNGVYLAENDHFLTYDLVPSHLPSSTAACKYFDLPFDDFARPGYEDWYDIPTPSLQKILLHQDFSDDVCRWMYILIGRLMYNLNEHDGWQVIPYLMGQAGSGKSSILVKVCRNLYDIADVGVLSNNLEKKFGLAAFAEKYVFIAPEIKHDLQLEQAEFQSLVSGEALQLNIKYKTAVTVDWITPGIMAGNEFPNFKNNSGSIDRRVIVFEFINSVVVGDMELGKKLEYEMPALIKKCNIAYREMVALCGRNDVWTHLPPYFKERRKELAEVTNTLADFVSNGPKLHGTTPNTPAAYILLDAFKDAYREFCLRNHYPSKKLNDSDIRSELRKYFPHVSICKKTCHVWPIGCGIARSGSYIETVGWRTDEDQDVLDI